VAAGLLCTMLRKLRCVSFPALGLSPAFGEACLSPLFKMCSACGMKEEQEMFPEQREELLLAQLFHPDASVVVEQLQFSSAHGMLCLTSIQKDAACPLCGGRGPRMHSQYACRLADLPWGQLPV